MRAMINEASHSGLGALQIFAFGPLSGRESAEIDGRKGHAAELEMLRLMSVVAGTRDVRGAVEFAC